MKKRLTFIYLLFGMFVYAQPITVEMDESELKKMEYSGVFKSALSLELAGGAGYAGIAYDLFLMEKIRLGVGVGYPGVGANLKIYPFGIGRAKYIFNVGVRTQLFLPPNETSAFIYNLPLGVSFFALNRLNFDLDFGPAYTMPANSNEMLNNFPKDLYFWGGLKIGYRFSFYNMKRVRQLNKLEGN